MARLSVIVGWGSRVLDSDQLVDTKQKTIFEGGTYDQRGGDGVLYNFDFAVLTFVMITFDNAFNL